MLNALKEAGPRNSSGWLARLTVPPERRFRRTPDKTPSKTPLAFNVSRQSVTLFRSPVLRKPKYYEPQLHQMLRNLDKERATWPGK